MIRRILPGAFLGTVAVVLAGPLHLAPLVLAIPVTPTPNGFVLLVVLVLAGVGVWRARRIPSADEPVGGCERGPLADYVRPEDDWADEKYPEDVTQR